RAPASDLFPSPPIALRFILLQSSLNNIHSNHRFDRALRFREGESAMSWLRSAVHKAVEVGGTGKNNLTRTVRNYADSVVLTAGNAVSEGAKLIQDRIGSRNVKSFSLEVKRLEEVSVSSRGGERVQLLRRWLVSLREVERMSLDQIQPSSEEAKDFTAILEAPNEEEVQMLLELFGLSLSGEKEVHEEVIQNVQDLAAVFSKYKDEVLAKREELLHYVQDAIGGLKISADLARIDTEAQALMEKLDKTKVKVLEKTSNGESSKTAGTSAASTEALREILEQVRTFSKLEALLLKKKSLRNGDSPQHHSEKVDKLKVLSESLLSSTSKEEKRIVDHSRSQKEEALSYRLSKTDEVSQREKDVAAELKKLEIMKEDLEAELKRVNTSITSARARLHNAREEREQFDNASNEILMHLKSKEDELTRSIGSCRVEADVVNKWIKFLEDTWIIQSKFAQQKEIQVSGEMERYGDHFIDLIVQLLSFYKEQLDPSIPKSEESSNFWNPVKEAEVKTEDKDAKPIDSRKKLEKEYLDLEAKFVTTLSVVDAMKKPFYSQTEGISRKDDKRVKELFEALDKTKEEFESIERPLLDIESPSRTSSSSSSRSPSLKMIPEVPLSFTVQKEFDGVETPDSKKGSSEKEDPAKKQLELELDDGEESLADEINDWEFDALDDTHIKNQ
ncbi:hypothetical protein IGI04_016724, partial [Brassica rapa subsp. trilocularis]